MSVSALDISRLIDYGCAKGDTRNKKRLAGTSPLRFRPVRTPSTDRQMVQENPECRHSRERNQRCSSFALTRTPLTCKGLSDCMHACFVSYGHHRSTQPSVIFIDLKTSTPPTTEISGNITERPDNRHVRLSATFKNRSKT